MRKLFRIFGKLIASILVLVFIASAFASIFLLAFNTRLFDLDFYLSAFDEVGFYEQLPAIAATQIKYSMEYNPCIEDPTNCEGDGIQEEGTSQGSPPSYFQALSEKDWELLLEGLLPPEWLENQVLAITGGLFESIDQGYGDVEIKIYLTDLKERLGGEEGVEAIVQLLDDQPECSKDDLLEMTRVLQGKEKPGEDFLNCRPPNDFIENRTPQLEVLLRRSLRDVPNEIDLGSGIFEDEGSVKLFGTKVPIFSFVKWIRWMINMSPLACLLLLVIIALFGVYSFKGLSGWWGYPLAISGLMGLTVSLLVGPVVNFFTNSFLKERDFMGISPVLINTGTDLAVEIIRSLFSQVRNFSLVVIGMGLAVIITAAVLKAPSGSEAEATGDEEEKEDIPEIPDSDPDAVEDSPDPAEPGEEIKLEEKNEEEDAPVPVDDDDEEEEEEEEE